jgi:hypothetical protein
VDITYVILKIFGHRLDDVLIFRRYHIVATMALALIVLAVTLDNTVAFDIIVAFVITWLPC